METNATKYKKIKLFFLVGLFFIFNSHSINAQVGIGTTTPSSTFEVNGSVGQKVNTVTANTTLNDTHNVVLCNNAATPITITLPAATSIAGRTYFIKREAASTANVTIAGTINGVTNLILKNANDAVTLISNGIEWKTLNNSNSTSAWSVNGNAGTTAGANYIGTTDAKALSIKTNAVERINVSSDGVTKIGDITNSNDTKIEADGTLMFEGNAVVFDDLRVSLDKGSSSASLEYFVGNSGPQIWYFRNNEGLEAMSFVVQLPHSYKEGTKIYPHIHWTPRSSRSGNVEWNLDYTWVNYDATSPQVFPATTTSTVVATGPFTTNTHVISSLTTGGIGLDGTGKKISSILVCRIWRNSSNSADTYGDDAGLLSLDFHYQIDTIGSRLEYVK